MSTFSTDGQSTAWTVYLLSSGMTKQRIHAPAHFHTAEYRSFWTGVSFLGAQKDLGASHIFKLSVEPSSFLLTKSHISVL